MDIQQKKVIIVTTAAVVFLTTTVGIFMLRRRKKKSISTVDGIVKPTSDMQKTVLRAEDMIPPTKWVKVGTVSGLHIYPLKSGRVMNVTKADATELGLQEICRKGRLPLRDRVFAVFREDNKNIVTNKTYAKLFKLTVNSLNNNSVEFSFDKEKIIVKIPESQKENNIELRKEIIPTVDCGDEVSVWVSKIILGKDNGLRIGYWPGGPRRDLTQVYADYLKVYNSFSNDFVGAYSDISSYLIVNQSTVDDLNSKLSDNKDRVTAYNFRPNIVVEGAPPYSEDEWIWVKIGEDSVFRIFKPCVRCSVTTINPETLEKSKSYEPIKTLKTYRQVKDLEQKKVEGESPVMGMYMGLHSKGGPVKFGDPVYVGTT